MTGPRDLRTFDRRDARALRPYDAKAARGRNARFWAHGSAALALLVASAFALSCSRSEHAARQTVPISTSSAAAREAYLAGRALVERQRNTDAREFFEAAVKADPEFALAYYGLAVAASTPKEFVDALQSASRVAGSASKGEILLIRALAAQANNDSQRQLDLLGKLLELYPEDERVHYLVGAVHFYRQEWDLACTSLRKAKAIEPSYPQPYNLLGYAHRHLGRYDEAAAEFKRYTELIPDEPNPYDSYAELLMKMGRFRESIDMYAKALDVNPNFAPSYIGMGNDYIFLDQPEKARKCFTKLAYIARTDGERRQALAWTAASYVHEGNHVSALKAIAKAAEIARAADDRIAMANDLNLSADVLVDAGRLDEALATYRESVAMMDTASVPDEIKNATHRAHLADTAQVALARGDVAEASKLADQHHKAVGAGAPVAEVWLSNELLGRISLANGDYTQAATLLDQANQAMPVVWFLKAKARLGMGDRDGARAACARAANHNALDFSFAFVRRRALRLLEKLGDSPLESPASQSIPSPRERARSGRASYGAPWRSASITSLRS